MVNLKMIYHELANEDFSAIDATIEVNGKTVAHYRNYNPANHSEIWENQTETFMIPTVEMGRQMFEMNLDYTVVKG